MQTTTTRSAITRTFHALLMGLLLATGASAHAGFFTPPPPPPHQPASVAAVRG